MDPNQHEMWVQLCRYNDTNATCALNSAKLRTDWIHLHHHEQEAFLFLTIPSKHETFNPLTAGAAYIRVLIFY